jgi:hypothetical protein
MGPCRRGQAGGRGDLGVATGVCVLGMRFCGASSDVLLMNGDHMPSVLLLFLLPFAFCAVLTA